MYVIFIPWTKHQHLFHLGNIIRIIRGLGVYTISYHFIFLIIFPFIIRIDLNRRAYLVAREITPVTRYNFLYSRIITALQSKIPILLIPHYINWIQHILTNKYTYLAMYLLQILKYSNNTTQYKRNISTINILWFAWRGKTRNTSPTN